MIRDAFFAQSFEPPHEDVETAAGMVRVVGLTAGEKDAFDVVHAKAEGKDFRPARRRDLPGLRRRPIFDGPASPASPRRPLPLIEPLVNAAIRVNRISDKIAEALAKND